MRPRRSIKTVAVLAAAAASSMTPVALGTAYTWSTTSGNWGDATKWTPNTGVPDDSSDSASLVGTTAGLSVKLATADGTDASFTISSLSMSTNSQGRSVTNVTDGVGTLTFDAPSGNATFTVNGTGSPARNLHVDVVLNDYLDVNVSSGSATITFSKAVTSGVAGTGINKIGGTFAQLLATNTYSGNTTIAGGILKLGANGSIDNSPQIVLAAASPTATVGAFDVSAKSSFTLLSGQTLRGNGKVVVGNSSTFTAQGTLAVGATHNQAVATAASIDLITGTSAAAYLAGTVQLDLVSAGGSADKFSTTGLLTLGGELAVADPNAIAFAENQVFDLFDAASFAGGFTSYSLPTLTGDLVWDTSSLTTDGSIRVAVPEPSSLAAAVILLAGGLGRRRRRRCSSIEPVQ